MLATQMSTAQRSLHKQTKATKKHEFPAVEMRMRKSEMEMREKETNETRKTDPQNHWKMNERAYNIVIFCVFDGGCGAADAATLFVIPRQKFNNSNRILSLALHSFTFRNTTNWVRQA